MKLARLHLLICTCVGLVGCADDGGPAEDPVVTAMGSTGTTGTDPAVTGSSDIGEPTPADDTAGTPGTDGSSGPGDPTTGGAATCGASGAFTVAPAGVTDRFGHLPFLMLFFNATSMDGSGMEEVSISNDGGQIGFSISPREIGSGNGHGGVGMVMGDIDPADCSFDITGQVPFVSDQGDFGMVSAHWVGTATPDAVTVACSLADGGIPMGPITFDLDIVP